MSFIKRYTSRLLLAVFSYILTPAALIHELHGHEDTRCIPGAAAIDIRHVHCRMLQIEAQVFTSPPPVLLESFTSPVTQFCAHQAETPCCATVLFAELRGPPQG